MIGEVTSCSREVVPPVAEIATLLLQSFTFGCQVLDVDCQVVIFSLERPAPGVQGLHVARQGCQLCLGCIQFLDDFSEDVVCITGEVVASCCFRSCAWIVGGFDSGRSSSGVLGVGVQAGSHRGRCFGVLVLVARLLTLVCCPGDKRSGVLVQVAVVPLGVLAGDGVLGVGVMAGSHGGRCSRDRVPAAGVLVAGVPETGVLVGFWRLASW